MVTRAIPIISLLSRSRDFPSRANLRLSPGSTVRPIDRLLARSLIHPLAHPSIRSSIYPSIRFCLLASFSLSFSLSLSLFLGHISLFLPFRLQSLRRDEQRRTHTFLARVRFAERRAAAVRVVDDKPLLGSDGSWLVLSLPLPLSLSVSTLLRVLTFGRRRSLVRSLTRSLTRSFRSFVVRSFVRRVRGAPTNTRSRRPLFALGLIVLTGRTADKQTDVFVRSAGISFRLIR